MHNPLGLRDPPPDVAGRDWWRCHAIPAATGRVCGYVNLANGHTRRLSPYCAGCGCTWVASNARKR